LRIAIGIFEKRLDSNKNAVYNMLASNKIAERRTNGKIESVPKEPEADARGNGVSVGYHGVDV
jgi:hypothetical protein